MKMDDEMAKAVAGFPDFAEFEGYSDSTVAVQNADHTQREKRRSSVSVMKKRRRRLARLKQTGNQ